MYGCYQIVLSLSTVYNCEVVREYVLMLASFLLTSHSSFYFFSISRPYLSFPALFPWTVHILLYKRGTQRIAWRFGLSNVHAAFL